MKKRVLSIFLFFLLCVVGCGKEKVEVTKPETEEKNQILVVYFSATSNTAKVANIIANKENADLFELEPIEPYTKEDLDWTNESSRVSMEHQDSSKQEIPLKSTEVPHWEDYKIVFLGYPIWWGNAAWPVRTFLQENDFTGKIIIPFCTSASSELGDSAKNLEELAKVGTWKEGKRFSSNVSKEEVEEWLKILEGNEIP